MWIDVINDGGGRRTTGCLRAALPRGVYSHTTPALYLRARLLRKHRNAFLPAALAFSFAAAAACARTHARRCRTPARTARAAH